MPSNIRVFVCALPGRVLARFARAIVRITACFRAIAITHLSLDLCSAPSRRFATLRPRVASRRRFRKSSTVWTEAFLYERTIDIERYDRHRDKLREELTLVQTDRHAAEFEELNVEGILAFAERVLPSASNLWVQTSLNQKQRLQRLFFPEGVRFDGKRRVGTGLTLPVFNYLSSVSESKKRTGGPGRSRTGTPRGAVF